MPLARQEAQAERKPPQFDRRRRPARSAQYIQELGGGPQLPPRATTSRERRRRRPRRRAVPDQLLVLPRASAAAAARCPPASTRRAWTTRPTAQIYAAMLTGPQNMPVFGDNQLTPEEKRDIIAYVQNLQGRPGPGRLGHRPVRPGAPRAWRSSWSAWWPWSSRRCGLRGSHDRRDTARRATTPAPSRSTCDDPRLTRFELVREGARRDGVEIVHYEPQFPVPGTKAEKRRRAHRSRCCSCSPACSRLAFVVAYIWWPWRVRAGRTASASSTRRCSASPSACSLLVLGFGDPRLGQEAAAATRSRSRTGTTAPSPRRRAADHRRRRMLEHGRRAGRPAPAAAQGGDPAAGRRRSGVAAVAPLIGGLIKNPQRATTILLTHRVRPGGTTTASRSA